MAPFNPISAYRLQFNRQFTLNQAGEIIPYLSRLGVKTIYASPVFKAVKGSSHGYDVTNPLAINPEIGTAGEFEQLIKKAREHNLRWIQDIVPNHMAYSTENPWIYDVLEKGKESPYYEFFDIVENHPDPDLNSRLMLPFFGKPLNELIRDRELSVVFSGKGLKLKYFDNEYPLSVPALLLVLKEAGLNPGPAGTAPLLDAGQTGTEFDLNPGNFAAWYQESDDVRGKVDSCLMDINSSPARLRQIIDQLYYFPSFWRDTETRINYRRFFTINGLICLNIQNEKVFDTCHSLIAEWLGNRFIDGLRIDHIDGLFNPAEYLERLRKLTGNNVSIYVEKILGEDEMLPVHWPVEGSTGYDFLGLVNNLLTNSDNGPLFHSFYEDWIHKPVNYDDIFFNKNRFILYKRLAGELDNLTRQCMALKAVQKLQVSERNIRTAIGEFLVACPVYKVYNSPSRFTEHDIQMVNTIGETAIRKNPDNTHAIKRLVQLFLLKLPGSNVAPGEVDVFFRRCMQYAGPLMAKGIEDTAFYSYNLFIGHNEVGDSPGYFGITVAKFHQAMEERCKNMPLAMNVLSTHDTKRGEDARARLNVLSDMPVKWMDEANTWKEINKNYKKRVDGREIPTPNDEYLIYQALCAHIPMNGIADESFLGCFKEYLVKAMREAKVNSSWSNPDEDYENETLNFIDKIYSEGLLFPKKLLSFMEVLIPHGIVNSITQVILKNTVPGVPDTYQGTETWNLSFVDPDNRREVDYVKLAHELESIENDYTSGAEALAQALYKNPLDGRLKQWITWITLKERLQFPGLFLKGNYIPLKVIGKYHKRVIAFYRSFEDQHLIVILPLSTATLEGDYLWEDTRIMLPKELPSAMTDLPTRSKIVTREFLQLEEIFSSIPFAILRNLSDTF